MQILWLQRLSSVIIGNGLKTIGGWPFDGCESINHIYCYAEDVPNLGGYYSSYYNSYVEKATLHVPAISLDLYKAKGPWKFFGEIIALTDSDPNPTGIISIEASDSEGAIYDLKGSRVEHPSKGLYIKNGKKYVVK